MSKNHLYKRSFHSDIQYKFEVTKLKKGIVDKKNTIDLNTQKCHNDVDSEYDI